MVIPWSPVLVSMGMLAVYQILAAAFNVYQDPPPSVDIPPDNCSFACRMAISNTIA